uniref:DUF5681 domain-containing protein n=1 Tax=viral metagenome TaxID=1070528 RepID=A0A6M3K232_9ZZZZ
MFVKGKSGNPVGRPKGSKDKRTEITNLIFGTHTHLTKRGKGLRKVAEDDPRFFYKEIFSRIIPKDLLLSLGDDAGEGFSALSEALVRALNRKSKLMKKVEEHTAANGGEDNGK